MDGVLQKCSLRPVACNRQGFAHFLRLVAEEQGNEGSHRQAAVSFRGVLPFWLTYRGFFSKNVHSDLLNPPISGLLPPLTPWMVSEDDSNRVSGSKSPRLR